LSIGKQWKEFLDYNDNIGFIVHEDAKKHDSEFFLAGIPMSVEPAELGYFFQEDHVRL
ncbi:hypothetical protein FRX31_015953, partial [Thalictrum thalictroides]